MCDKNNNGNCFANILEKIILLQQIGQNNTLGCDKPFLGNTSLIANTRPLNIYSCCNNTLWSIPYNYNNQQGTSSFFRVENINDNCATFRILIREENSYTATNNFFIMNLNCIGSIKCLADTLIENI
ncbi:MAG: hypothetical protein J6A52_07555 [Bacilli bacterium]|nr:hypothetical protein [Bacilli bacterium]